MTLKECTKEELIYIIERLAFKGFYKNSDIEVELCLSEVRYNRQKKLLNEAEKWNKIASNKRNEYIELITKWKYKNLKDIPQEITQRAEQLIKEAQSADKKYDACIRKVIY